MENSKDAVPQETVAAHITKSKFILPAEQVASLSRGRNSMVSPTLPTALNACPDETVAPKSPVEFAITPVSAATPVVAGKVGHHIVRNSDFVAAAFQTTPDNAHAAICSMLGDPTSGKWYAMKADAIDLQSPPDRNNYVNSSCFYADEKGNVHARKDNFAAFHVLMLDDVGTKVQWSRLRGFPPSYITQTSPGNYQVGYFLAEPLTDIDYATQLKNAVIEAGLCDPGAHGVARWARLPNGINGKPKYKSELGEPSRCRLVRWNPERRYTVDEIVEGLGLKLGATAAPQANVQADAIEHNSGALGTAPECATLDAAGYQTLVSLLENLSSNLPYHDWVRVLMAVHHETGGSVRGLALADKWCSKGQKYPGFKAIDAKWKSFEGYSGKPIAIGTLKKMVREAGTGVDGIVNAPVSDRAAVSAYADKQATTDKSSQNPLLQYSLRDDLEKLERNLVAQIQILGQLVLLGQATVIYALAGTGKTLIVLYLIIQAIKDGLIDPSKVFYINMDDNGSGVVEKVRLAAEYGFHLAADGHKGFQAKNFRASMEKMIEEDSAGGVVAVLDTLKKFVDTMSKTESADFARVVRQFVLKGGTVLALSHANKNPGPDGRIVYSGTTDILDDFDCGFTMATVAQQDDSTQKLVEFRNIKRRGNVALNAAYSYALEPKLSYDELLLSVHEVDPLQLVPLKQAPEIQSDVTVISAIEACISDGINTKMKLAEAASKRAAVSNRAALRTIDKYTGNDPGVHRWAFILQGHGAKVFQLLQGTLPASPAATMPDSDTLQAGPVLVPDAPAAELDLDAQHHTEILEKFDRLLGITQVPASENDEY